MKNFLIIPGLIVTTVASSFAQGRIVFANSTATRVFVEIAPDVITFVPAGSQFTVELMFAPDGTPSDAFDSVAVRIGATTFFSPGLFNGGGTTVAGVSPPGGWALLQVRGWETAGGVDYRSAVATGDPNIRAGTSAILRADMDDPTGGGGSPVPTTLVHAGLQSFTLTPVPEPSTIALAAVALGAFLMVCRRKIE